MSEQNMEFEERREAVSLEEISQEEIAEIVENVRISGVEEDMPLEAVILNLITGHQELTQYKKGALSLHKGLDERIKEEKAADGPNKELIEILEQVKESAFGLYLRVQRGDQELSGNRDGEYSDYFKE